MSEKDNSVDLQKLSQKELLIVTYRKVDELSITVKEINEKQGDHEVRISLVEQRVKLWGAAFGSVSAIITEIIIKLLLK